MSFEQDGRRRTHLHGIAAGSLVVLALFLFWTVPGAVYRLLTGEISWSTVAYPGLFSLIVVIGIRETRAWRRGASKPPAPA